MRGDCSRVSRYRVRGLTLIELLVSLTIGLMVAGATVAGYLALAEASRMAEAQARMNEDGQAALAVLSAHLRMAGNNPDQPYRVPTTRRNPVFASPLSFAVRGCDGKFANITSAAAAEDLVCGGGTTSDPDSFSVTYEADRYNTVTLPPDWTPTDCVGNPLAISTATMTVITPPGPTTTTAAVNYHVAENRFYIDASGPGTPPSLHCRGNGAASTPRPLVENVEDMQLTFGTVPAAAPTHSANIAGYLDATGVSAHAALATLPDEAARWGKVASVRVCVVVRSSNPLAGGEGSARYLRCDGSLEESPPDTRLRRAYSTTVVLRNRR